MKAANFTDTYTLASMSCKAQIQIICFLDDQHPKTFLAHDTSQAKEPMIILYA